MKDYKDLVSWQKGMTLAAEVYRMTKTFPKEETYGLVSQIRRSVISIPSNIAEGYGRESTQEYIRFLRIARGSLYETETQLYLCQQLQYISQEDSTTAFALCSEIGRMLNTMLQRLNPIKDNGK